MTVYCNEDISVIAYRLFLRSLVIEAIYALALMIPRHLTSTE